MSAPQETTVTIEVVITSGYRRASAVRYALQKLLERGDLPIREDFPLINTSRLGKITKVTR